MIDCVVWDENNWEGETFGFFLKLTLKEVEYLESEIAKDPNSALSLDRGDSLPCKPEDEELMGKLDRASGNTYMAYLDYYSLKEDRLTDGESPDFESLEVLYEYIFYKAKDLKIVSLEEYLNNV